eukprot:2704358-Lingulodinium_polyedra.AAC.1
MPARRTCSRQMPKPSRRVGIRRSAGAPSFPSQASLCPRPAMAARWPGFGRRGPAYFVSDLEPPVEEVETATVPIEL